jgi:hypothetical protein
MSTYLEIAAAFLALGVYVFGLFRWWYRQLKTLAERYDIPERRRRAACRYPVVMLMLATPYLIILLWGIRTIPASGDLVGIILASSVIPGLVWWCRKMSGLAALGYGRQRRS